MYERLLSGPDNSIKSLLYILKITNTVLVAGISLGYIKIPVKLANFIYFLILFFIQISVLQFL